MSYYETENKERPSKTRGQKIERGIALGSLIAVVAYVILTASTLSEIKKQAISAQVQIGIMQKQLEAADRPWVKLVNLNTPRITFAGPRFQTKLGSKDEVFLNVTPEIKNIGRSTATHVRMRVQLVVHQWANGWGNFKTEQNSMCESIAKTMDGATDIVLFPEDPFDGMGVGSGELLSPEHISVSNGVQYIAPALVGCIDYQFQSSPVHHHTAFAFEIVRADNRSRIFVVGVDMLPQQILLIKDPQYDSAN